MRVTDLPVEFAPLRGQVQYIRRKSPTEYSGSCPDCGGSPHADGSWPDRLVMLTRSAATGGALAWCRRCGYKWWEGKDEKNTLTPEEKAAWIAEREKQERIARELAELSHQAALSALRESKAWERYHEALTGDLRDLWRKRGIPDEFQDYWQFGYCPDFLYYRMVTENGEEVSRQLHTPTITIPIFGAGWEVLNVRHRLLLPVDPSDKYRPERRDLYAPPWLADPDKPLSECTRVMVIEGEIKAAVTYLTLDDPNLQIVGMPGTRTWDAIQPQLVGKQVIISLDPDARALGREYANQIGARVLELPMKIDDAINDGILKKQDLLRYINQARYIAKGSIPEDEIRRNRKAGVV